MSDTVSCGRGHWISSHYNSCPLCADEEREQRRTGGGGGGGVAGLVLVIWIPVAVVAVALLVLGEVSRLFERMNAALGISGATAYAVWTPVLAAAAWLFPRLGAAVCKGFAVLLALLGVYQQCAALTMPVTPYNRYGPLVTAAAFGALAVGLRRLADRRARARGRDPVAGLQSRVAAAWRTRRGAEPPRPAGATVGAGARAPTRLILPPDATAADAEPGRRRRYPY